MLPSGEVIRKRIALQLTRRVNGLCTILNWIVPQSVTTYEEIQGKTDDEIIAYNSNMHSELAVLENEFIHMDDSNFNQSLVQLKRIILSKHLSWEQQEQRDAA